MRINNVDDASPVSRAVKHLSVIDVRKDNDLDLFVRRAVLRLLFSLEVVGHGRRIDNQVPAR